MIELLRSNGCGYGLVTALLADAGIQAAMLVFITVCCRRNWNPAAPLTVIVEDGGRVVEAGAQPAEPLIGVKVAVVLLQRPPICHRGASIRKGRRHQTIARRGADFDLGCGVGKRRRCAWRGASLASLVCAEAGSRAGLHRSRCWQQHRCKRPATGRRASACSAILSTPLH